MRQVHYCRSVDWPQPPHSFRDCGGTLQVQSSQEMRSFRTSAVDGSVTTKRTWAYLTFSCPHQYLPQPSSPLVLSSSRLFLPVYLPSLHYVLCTSIFCPCGGLRTYRYVSACVTAALHRAYIQHHESCGSNMTRHRISARRHTDSLSYPAREAYIHKRLHTSTRTPSSPLTGRRSYRAAHEVRLESTAPINYDELRCSLQEEGEHANGAPPFVPSPFGL